MKKYFILMFILATWIMPEYSYANLKIDFEDQNTLEEAARKLSKGSKVIFDKLPNNKFVIKSVECQKENPQWGWNRMSLEFLQAYLEKGEITKVTSKLGREDFNPTTLSLVVDLSIKKNQLKFILNYELEKE